MFPKIGRKWLEYVTPMRWFFKGMVTSLYSWWLNFQIDTIVKKNHRKVIKKLVKNSFVNFLNTYEFFWTLVKFLKTPFIEKCFSRIYESYRSIIQTLPEFLTSRVRSFFAKTYLNFVTFDRFFKTKQKFRRLEKNLKKFICSRTNWKINFG